MVQRLSKKKTGALEAQMRKRLAMLRADIGRALERSEQESHQVIAGEVSNMEDAAFVRMVRELELADIERDAAEIHDIDAALRRIEDGHYGLCLDCSEAIAVERLQAYPSAKRCHACQEAVERAHARS